MDNSKKIQIPGPAGNIEALLHEPEHPPTALAIMCHPHSLHGGTMQNKVVYTLSRAFESAGAVTIRFNFRGVGESEGTFDNGFGESTDLAAVHQWAREQLPLWLAGFSFGSFVAARMALDLNATRLISIAPAVTRFDFKEMTLPTCPWLIVQGDADEVVEPSAVFEWAKGLPASAQLQVIPDVGHFFHGQLITLRDIVLEWIK